MNNQIACAAAELLLLQRRHSLPVDPSELVSKQPIYFFSLSEYCKKTRQSRLRLTKDFVSKDGVTLILPRSGQRTQYFILYNEEVRPFSRIRFTLAHEIGHILLEHKTDDMMQERQADQFAAELLAPRILVNELKFLKPRLTVAELSRCFGISVRSAMRRLRDVENHENYSTAELNLLEIYSGIIRDCF